MRLRDRRSELRELELRRTGPDGSASPLTAGSLEAVRQAGEALLDAADEAIDRGLSGHSEAFLTSGRQQGGQ
jgi:hypothetical protein